MSYRFTLDWTDHVDMTYWQGHGAPTGFSFSGCSSTDDTFLSNTEARWGIGPGGSVNVNDYFWGKGNVGPDVPRSAVTGWWYISGNS